MALIHAKPLQVIPLQPAQPDHEPAADSRPTGSSLFSTSLLRSEHLQLMRLVLHPGQVLADHHVPGEITIQCLAGEVDIVMAETTASLSAGTLVMLPGGVSHSVHARGEAVLLLTILLDSPMHRASPRS